MLVTVAYHLLPHAYAEPRRQTLGSVGYDLYAAHEQRKDPLVI